MTDLEEAARDAGATQLGDLGPDGAHWIFSREQLEAFVELLARPCEAPKRATLPPLPY